jgi:hypothetical protein
VDRLARRAGLNRGRRALFAVGAVSEEVLRAADGTPLRNTGRIRVRPADGALIDAPRAGCIRAGSPWGPTPR